MWLRVSWKGEGVARVLWTGRGRHAGGVWWTGCGRHTGGVWHGCGGRGVAGGWRGGVTVRVVLGGGRILGGGVWVW